MPYYIVIRGPSGAGKTTIAIQLASILMADYISIDKVLKDLKPEINSGDVEKYMFQDDWQNPNEESDEEGTPLKTLFRASEQTYPQARRTLHNNGIVIYDGEFYSQDQLEDLSRSLRYPHNTFTLKASLKTCIERAGKNGEAVEASYKLATMFDYGVVIDTENKTVEDVVKNIIARLPSAVLVSLLPE